MAERNNSLIYSLIIVFLILLCGFFILPFLSYPITLMFILLSFTITLFKPEYGVYLVVFLAPLLVRFGERFGPFPFSIIELIFLSVFLAFVIKKATNKEKLFIKTPLDKPIIAYLLLILLSSLLFFTKINPSFGTFFSRLNHILVIQPWDPYFFMYLLFNIVEVIAFFYLIVNTIKTKKQINNIVFLLLLSAFFVCSFAVFQVVKSHYAASADFYDSNEFGGYLTLIVPLAFSLAFFNKEKKHWFYIFMAIFSSIALILSISAGALVGVFAGILLLIILSFKKEFSFAKHHKIIATIILVLVVLSSVFLFSIKDTRSCTHNVFCRNAFQIFDEKLDSNFASGRVHYWNLGLDLFRQNPLFGGGLGSYMAINQVGYQHYVYNYFLIIAAETGIFALAAFIWLLARIYKTTFSFIKKQGFNALMIGLICSISATLVHSLVQHHLAIVEILFIFWIEIALIVLITKLKK